MGTLISILIILSAIFAGYSTKKFYDRPQIVNFALAVMLALLVIRTFMLQPIATAGWVAIVICSIAFVMQLVLGIRNSRTAKSNTKKHA